MLALPKELNDEQRIELVKDFAEHATEGRAPWLAAFHMKGKDARNPHCHLVLRDRDPETNKRVIGTSAIFFIVLSTSVGVLGWLFTPAILGTAKNASFDPGSGRLGGTSAKADVAVRANQVETGRVGLIAMMEGAFRIPDQ